MLLFDLLYPTTGFLSKTRQDAHARFYFRPAVNGDQFPVPVNCRLPCLYRLAFYGVLIYPGSYHLLLMYKVSLISLAINENDYSFSFALFICCCK